MRRKVFMKNINNLKVTDDIVRESEKWNEGDIVEINLSRVKKAFPNHSVLFSAILEYYSRAKKIKFIFSGRNGYALNSRAGSYYTVNEIRKATKFSDKVVKFNSPEEALEITNHFIDELIGSIKCKEGVIDTLQWCIYEVLDNVFEHSQAPCGFVMMQIQSEKKQCVIAIADSGRGIHKAMYDASEGSSVDKSKIKTASDAIAHAMEKGVTSKGKQNQGNGLHGLKSSVEINGGALMIQSGRGNWSYREGTVEKKNLPKRPMLNIENAHTTLVDWRLNCETPVDISQAIASKFTTRNILEKYEGDEDYIEIGFEEIMRASGSRRLSRELRIKIENLIQTGATYIVFNMRNINVISSSFADELFGKLALNLGIESYKKKIFLNNGNRQVKMLIEVATEKRLSDLIH